MDAKISVTTRCNARCATCPVWQHPGKDMDFSDFVVIWNKLMDSKHVTRVLLNNTGDMYIHQDRERIFDYIEANHHKPVIMTTNAAAMDRVPKIDEIIISFNGGNKESYEKTTGLVFEKVVARIREHYDALFKVHAEMHCLIWDGNAGCEDDFKELWKDFPGRLRFSYKYDNQMKEDHTIDGKRQSQRFPCDYLRMLNVMPDGRIISCAHDFEAVTDFGNLLTGSVDDTICNINRGDKIAEHCRHEYTGLCEKCNYNTALADRIVYVR